MADRDDGSLSNREYGIARAYADGRSYKEIARDLKIAPATVRAHLRTVYRKLDVTSKVALARAIPAPGGGPGVPVAEPAGDPGPTAASRSVWLAVRLVADAGASEASVLLARGMTDDIVAELTRFNRISALGAESSARFLQDGADEREAGRPAIQYILGGSVREMAGSIRLLFSLEDRQSGQMIWSERFLSTAADFFALQEQIVGRVAATVVGRAEAAISIRAARRQPESLDAYQCVLKAKSLELGNPSVEMQRHALFERATRLDPGYAVAQAWLAHATLLQWDRQLSQDDSLRERALDLARLAVSLDASDPFCQYIIGFVHLFSRRFDLAEAYYRRMAELSPNDAELVGAMALFLAYAGRGDEALAQTGRARQLDPYFEPAWLWHAEGLAHFVNADYARAVAAFDRSATTPYWVVAYQAAAEALGGRPEPAARHAGRVRSLRPQFRSGFFARREPLKREEDRGALLRGLAGSGLAP
ncbi:MAG: LuxR C-terminal-related transcriptional regulator [Paracoccaceae bacterium]